MLTEGAVGGCGTLRGLSKTNMHTKMGELV